MAKKGVWVADKGRNREHSRVTLYIGPTDKAVWNVARQRAAKAGVSLSAAVTRVLVDSLCEHDICPQCGSDDYMETGCLNCAELARKGAK